MLKLNNDKNCSTVVSEPPFLLLLDEDSLSSLQWGKLACGGARKIQLVHFSTYFQKRHYTMWIMHSVNTKCRAKYLHTHCP